MVVIVIKTILTKEIEKAALREFSKMGSFICQEVGINIKRYGFSKRFYKGVNLTEKEMFERGWRPNWIADTEIVDLLIWEAGKDIWKCFEIKISYSDFKSSASKTFVGDYNYYLIPDTLLEKVKDKIPKEIGIYVYDTTESIYKYRKRISCYKKAKKQSRKCLKSELYYGMIKSLYREKDKYDKKL